MADTIDTLVPLSGMISWHRADAITGLADGDPVVVLPDIFGGLDLDPITSPEPSWDVNMINGLPAVSWNGSTHRPLAYTGSLLVKHAFVVGSYIDATFATDYPGLLTDLSTVPILVGDPATAKFVDHSYGSTYTYRRRDQIYANNNQLASMSNAFGVFEASLPAGFAMDGIQVGQDRGFSARKWKGRLAEMLLYSVVLTDEQRRDIYEYFALKYLLWKRITSGLNVWPFEPEWSRPMVLDKRVISSTSVSGVNKSRSKADKKIALEPQFTSRWPEEYDAAVSFWDEHYPGTSFVYRDSAFSPQRDTTMRFVSGMAQQNANYRDITYSFQAIES